MRFTIGTRLFLALTAVSLLILTLNAGITRWTLQRGFLEYVGEQELVLINRAAANLATAYQSTEGWQGIRDNPRRWNDLLRQSGRPPPIAPRGGPPLGPPPGPGRPAPDDPLELGRRVSLTDADGNLVMGRPSLEDAARSVPVRVNGETVGTVNIAPRQQLTSQIDQNFAREQARSIYLIAAAALILAAGISAVLARQLTRPLRSLADGARAISGGDYDTRMSLARDDELGDLAREFNALADTLEKGRVARRQWVADIAHELRTPLAVLRGELDALEDGVRTFDAASQRSLQDETARLTKLVGELHELSVYDEGGKDFQRMSLDIVTLLKDALEGAGHRLEAAGIELDVHLPESSMTVEADATKLERLFFNLIENTLRYTARPGRLVVTGSSTEKEIRLDFADSAPGASRAALERLFDRLFRADMSRSRETGGSGLGLAICKAIVEGHNGRIEAMDSDFGGVTIRIHLPLAATPGADS
ncbi:MAG: ATP-binding protein [Pseudomonadota bacterium]